MPNEINQQDQTMSDPHWLRTQIGILTVLEVAVLLDVTEQTLAQWRADKRGPDFVKLGRTVFYRREDVQKWVALNVVPVEQHGNA